MIVISINVSCCSDIWFYNHFHIVITNENVQVLFNEFWDVSRTYLFYVLGIVSFWKYQMMGYGFTMIDEIKMMQKKSSEMPGQASDSETLAWDKKLIFVKGRSSSPKETVQFFQLVIVHTKENKTCRGSVQAKWTFCSAHSMVFFVFKVTIFQFAHINFLGNKYILKVIFVQPFLKGRILGAFHKGRVQKKKSGNFQIWSDPPTHPCNQKKSGKKIKFLSF